MYQIYCNSNFRLVKTLKILYLCTIKNQYYDFRKIKKFTRLSRFN